MGIYLFAASGTEERIGASQARCRQTDGPGLGRAIDPGPRSARAPFPPRQCLGCGRRFTPRRADQRHCDGRCRAQASRDADRERTRDLVVALDAAIAVGNFHAARRALGDARRGAPSARDSRNADGAALCGSASDEGTDRALTCLTSAAEAWTVQGRLRRAAPGRSRRHSLAGRLVAVGTADCRSTCVIVDDEAQRLDLVTLELHGLLGRSVDVMEQHDQDWRRQAAALILLEQFCLSLRVLQDPLGKFPHLAGHFVLNALRTPR